ncbi:DUF663-domain-containing protein, partial [Lepidopterella palustris CBS 459.81]
MAPMMDHHHRSTTKHPQKAFKARHATKSALKERSKGKIENEERGMRRTPHQQIMSKMDRRNQAKQKRLMNHSEHLRATNVFAGREGAPRLVAVVPLCEDVSAAAAVRSLNISLDLEEEVPEVGWVRTSIDRFKQRVSYIVVKRDLLASLDACRTADFVIFVLSAKQEVDQHGELILRSIEGQGVSNTFAVVQGLDSIPPKKKPQTLSSLKSYIAYFLPTVEKVHSLDSRQESSNLVRSLCSTTPKGVHWREDRSWMFVEDVQFPGGKAAMTDHGTGEAIITGVVRGRALQADRLVQIGDWGDFQIEKITAAPLNTGKKGRDDTMVVDADEQNAILSEPGAEQDDLNSLAPEEAVMKDVDNYPVSIAPSERKGVLLDDHHYFSDEDEFSMAPRPKRLPKGTSQYQSAWYLDDVSDSGSDLEDIEDDEGDVTMNTPAHPADGVEGFTRAPTEVGPSEYPQSEMFLDPSPEDEGEAAALAAYRSRKTEGEEDLEFPDEIELRPNVLARERLARYRGLKSLRTSNWETNEDKPHEPSEWPRLLEIANFKRQSQQILREGLVGGVTAGTRVHVHLRAVPLSIQQAYNPSRPLCLFSLLRHEHKQTAVNYSISLSSDYPTPLKSKSELIVQCGHRRFVI